MSKVRPQPRRPQPGVSADLPPAPLFLPPLPPQRRLLWVFSIAFATWVLALLAMWLFTGGRSPLLDAPRQQRSAAER